MTSSALKLSPPTAGASPHANGSSATADSSRRECDVEQDSPTHKTVQTYARPLQELVSLAKEGERDGLQSHVNALQARAIRLTSIAETAADAVRDTPKLMRQDIQPP